VLTENNEDGNDDTTAFPTKQKKKLNEVH